MARKRKIRTINVRESDVSRGDFRGLGAGATGTWGDSQPIINDQGYVTVNEWGEPIATPGQSAPWYAGGSWTVYDWITQPAGVNPVTGQTESGGLFQHVDDAATTVKETLTNIGDSVSSSVTEIVKWGLLAVAVYFFFTSHRD